MTLQFDKTTELINTQFAPLAALVAYYDKQSVFEPLQSVLSTTNNVTFDLSDKLIQVFCQTWVHMNIGQQIL